MLTHQESKIGGRVHWLSVQQFSVHSHPKTQSAHTLITTFVFTSITSVIYEQKKELLDANSEKYIA